MKYIPIIGMFLLLLISNQLFSQYVSESLARKVASNFNYRYDQLERNIVRQKDLQNGFTNLDEKNYLSDSSIVRTYSEKSNGNVSYYVFSFKNGGFSIVSGHKSKGPILAYSSSGKFDPDNVPPAFKLILSDYNKILDYSIKNQISDSMNIIEWDQLEKGDYNNLDRIWNSTNKKSGGSSGAYPEYLLTTIWGQDQTNDLDCPGYNSHPDIPSNSGCADFCSKCAAGCVAVAVAQIMNYWNFAKGNEADFEWWNMPYSGLHKYEDETIFNKERLAVSYLMQRIGNEVDMDYCSDGCASGAFLNCPWPYFGCDGDNDAESALIRFGYDEGSLNYIDKSWHTYTSWVNLLKTEIQSNRPILYGVEGHALVVDGYNSSNDYLHWNFGWNGYADNWVDFEDLAGVDYDFTDVSKHNCFTGLTPDISDNIIFNSTVILTSGSNKTYFVSNYITASNNNNTFNVQDDAKCSFIAGNTITLKPGFLVQTGGIFLAKIFPESTSKKSIKGINILNPFNEINNTTKIKDIPFNEFVDIYPNPTSGWLQINCSENIEPKLLSIFDINGNVIKQVQMNSINFTIDLRSVNKGIYIIKIQTANQILTKRVILQ